MSFTPDPTLIGSVSGQLVLKDDALNTGAPGYETQSISLSETATPTYTLAAMIIACAGKHAERIERDLQLDGGQWLDRVRPAHRHHRRRQRCP
jgi:hypothetical protein